MLYAGLDFSRKRVNFDARRAGGELAVRGACPPDAGGVCGLAQPLLGQDPEEPAARFVHDQLERHGASTSASPTPSAARGSRRRPATPTGSTPSCSRSSPARPRPLRSGCPIPATGRTAGRARFRLEVGRKRTALRNSTLITWAKPCPVSDLFGRSGRELLSRLNVPELWLSTLEASLRLIDQLDEEIMAQERALHRSEPNTPYIPLLTTVAGIAWVLGFTIAREIGSIECFASPKKLTRSTGLCPKVDQSGEHDRRGRPKKNGPPYPALGADRGHPARRPLSAIPRALPAHQEAPRPRARSEGAAIIVARKLANAIWHMLTYDKPFDSASAQEPLAA
jgi:transposase